MNDMTPFTIEVASGPEAQVFDIVPLGNSRYEIFIDNDTIGSIQLDEQDHARCESIGCELDLPLLHAIRDQIRIHEQQTR